MATTYLPLLTLALAGSLLLAGCAERPTRSSTAPATTAPASTSTPPSATHRAATGTPSGAAATAGNLPDSTGVAACDDYLSSYKACHRAAGIYAPNQLEDRYQAMRTSLLRDSLNPDIRPQLANRCNSLASQLRQSLHGKPCETEPASTSSR